jgi:hypothetical protein
MSDPTVVYQNSDTFYGCVPFDKSNTFVVAGGAPTTLIYQLRDANGTPIDLSSFFPTITEEGNSEENAEETANGVFVRFAIADNTAIATQYERGQAVDPKNGKVQIELPEYVYNIPCIYTFYVSVADVVSFPVDRKPKYVAPGRGLLLVEWSPFMEHVLSVRQVHRVVPSLEDIRRKLDDFVGKNDLLHQVEFSADDIVNAMIRPVHIFNEAIPRLQNHTYSLTTFPYYDNWIIGTAAELLQIAVMHYTRNKLLASHGGLSGDEKQRDREYLQLAEIYRKEYRMWVADKKAELNAGPGQGWGTIHSDYLYVR